MKKLNKPYILAKRINHHINKCFFFKKAAVLNLGESVIQNKLQLYFSARDDKKDIVKLRYLVWTRASQQASCLNLFFSFFPKLAMSFEYLIIYSRFTKS